MHAVRDQLVHSSAVHQISAVTAYNYALCCLNVVALCILSLCLPLCNVCSAANHRRTPDGLGNRKLQTSDLEKHFHNELRRRRFFAVAEFTPPASLEQ
jgi:hypothetical protein